VVVHTPKATLSSGFHRLQTRYALYFNKRYHSRGHVFARRFESKVIESAAMQLETVRYVALNPTRARLCRLPEEYPWCAYGSLIGLYPRDPIIDAKAALAPVGGSRAAYRKFVEELDPRIRRGQTRARPLKS
jgi:putative transposase